MSLFSGSDQASIALPGRTQAMPGITRHHVNQRPLQVPLARNQEQAVFGLGCFWGGERLFWKLPGVHVTAVGYAGGSTPNPLYEEVCSGRTGHAEVVNVIFVPELISYEQLLKVFWEAHDPTQGMRQGNDQGTQYRSVIYTTTPVQTELAMASRKIMQEALNAAGYGPVTTEISKLTHFYFAEDYHQQYLAKNPLGYCGLAGTGVSYPSSAVLVDADVDVGEKNSRI
ncbi:MAG: peptide-methionine (S)-S-oxide reductase MsrA [Pseudomonadales bacterium]|nr:peptide-methionine (S)-S-oxide reductase MsrA [Pseudomonadales bacterium]